MTLAQKVYHFLQVDHLICDWDGKPLNGFTGYLKLDLHPQYFYFTLGWLKAFFGDHRILRFHDESCYANFVREGKLRELAR